MEYILISVTQRCSQGEILFTISFGDVQCIGLRGLSCILFLVIRRMWEHISNHRQGLGKLMLFFFGNSDLQRPEDRTKVSHGSLKKRYNHLNVPGTSEIWKAKWRGIWTTKVAYILFGNNTWVVGNEPYVGIEFVSTMNYANQMKRK